MAARSYQRGLVFAFLTILIALGASTLFAMPQERSRQGTRRRQPPPTIEPAQPGRQPSPPDRGSGRFDWEGMVGGILQGMQEGGSRPYRPGRVPGGSRPQYIEPVRPQYVQPAFPHEVIPQPGVTVPGNVIAEPQPNEVLHRVPEQPSPLQGRVWEASVREARCYGKELQNMIQDHLASVLGDLGKNNGDLAAIRAQFEDLQRLIQNNAPWPEIEPVLRRLLEENQATFSEAMMEQLQRVLQLVLVRDGFLMVGNDAPRGRGTSMFIPGIPTGLIWIVYDPTLAVGTGLLIGERIMVCGGGGKGNC